MKNGKPQYEIVRPGPITDEVEKIFKFIKNHIEDFREMERIQERIDNLNVSPLQQRINNIRKIAKESCDRIDEMEDRGPWFRPRPFPKFRDFGIGFQFSPLSEPPKSVNQNHESDETIHRQKTEREPGL